MTAAIPADLEAAYEATVVNIHGDDPAVWSFANTVGTHDRWLAKRGAVAAVVITAWNPFSRSESHERNTAENAALRSAIEQAKLTWVSAVGTGQDGAWFEDSFCVFDVPDDLLDEWLVTFQQNAAFRVRVGGRVELVWHRRFRRTPEHGLA